MKYRRTVQRCLEKKKALDLEHKLTFIRLLCSRYSFRDTVRRDVRTHILVRRELLFLKLKRADADHLHVLNTQSRQGALRLTYRSVRDAHGLDGALGCPKRLLKEPGLCVSERIAEIYDLESG